MSAPDRFSDSSSDPAVHGFLHRPGSPSSDGLVLTHGAGGNAQSGLLVALAETFAGAGLVVLRCDLPFRQKRAYGPPRPGDAARDRLGLKHAISARSNWRTGCFCSLILCTRRAAPINFAPSICRRSMFQHYSCTEPAILLELLKRSRRRER